MITASYQSMVFSSMLTRMNSVILLAACIFHGEVQIFHDLVSQIPNLQGHFYDEIRIANETAGVLQSCSYG